MIRIGSSSVRPIPNHNDISSVHLHSTWIYLNNTHRFRNNLTVWARRSIITSHTTHLFRERSKSNIFEYFPYSHVDLLYRCISFWLTALWLITTFLLLLKLLLLANRLKQVFGVGFTYGAVPWVTMLGYRKVFRALAGIEWGGELMHVWDVI